MSERASNSILRKIKRRLAIKSPSAELLPDSLRRMQIPATPFEASVFVYALKSPDKAKEKTVLVCELDEVDLPHIYAAYKVKLKADDVLQAITAGLLRLSATIRTDKRFRRGGNIILLNGAN